MGSRAALASVVIYGGLSSAKRAAALELTVAKAFRQWRLPEELASEQSRTCIRLNVLVMTRAGMVLGAEVVKPRVLWRLVYLVPVVAGCDCSWRWRSGAQAASCSAGVRIPMAECGRVVPVPVDPLGGGEHRRRRCPPKGPGYGSARPCTRSSEPRPEQSRKESPFDPTEATASQSDRACP